MKKKMLLLFCAALLPSLHSFAQTDSLSGDWRGIWTNPAGFVLTAEMTLQAGSGCKTCAVSGNGSVQGKIVWTLRKAGSNSPGEYAGKVGMTGTEYVKGEMRGSGLLVLDGYDKQDPNAIISIDKYRLAISDTGQVIGGITFNNGSWRGQFIAKRVEP